MYIFVFVIFCKYLIQTKRLSKSQSASLQLFTSIKLDACLPSTNIWSIWLLVLSLGDCQVYVCIILCGKYGLFISLLLLLLLLLLILLLLLLLLLLAKSIVLVLYSFDASCRLHFCITGIKSSLPVLAWVAHYNFCIMCWNSLIYLIKFIVTGVLNKLVLFFHRCMYQNYFKIIELLAHFQWAYSIIHCHKVHNRLFILPVLKVLLSLPLHIVCNSVYPTFHFPTFLSPGLL